MCLRRKAGADAGGRAPRSRLPRPADFFRNKMKKFPTFPKEERRNFANSGRKRSRDHKPRIQILPLVPGERAAWDPCGAPSPTSAAQRLRKTRLSKSRRLSRRSELQTFRINIWKARITRSRNELWTILLEKLPLI